MSCMISMDGNRNILSLGNPLVCTVICHGSSRVSSSSNEICKSYNRPMGWCLTDKPAHFFVRSFQWYRQCNLFSFFIVKRCLTISMADSCTRTKLPFRPDWHQEIELAILEWSPASKNFVPLASNGNRCCRHNALSNSTPPPLSLSLLQIRVYWTFRPE